MSAVFYLVYFALVEAASFSVANASNSTAEAENVPRSPTKHKRSLFRRELTHGMLGQHSVAVELGVRGMAHSSTSAIERQNEQSMSRSIHRVTESSLLQAVGVQGQSALFEKSRGVEPSENSEDEACDVKGRNAVQLASSSVEYVVSSFREELDWLLELDVPATVYVHDRDMQVTHCTGDDCIIGDPMTASESQKALEQAKRSFPVKFVQLTNFGDEGVAFLKHIIERYDDLSNDDESKTSALVFLHGHRNSWHAPFDMPEKLKRACFNIKEGYRSLNAGSDFDNASPCMHFAANKEEDENENVRSKHATISKSWSDVFEPELGAFPDTVCMDCCSQFVVTPSVLLRHPKSFYEKLLRIVRAGDTSLEMEWRMIFVPREEIGVRRYPKHL
eukprot:TRINITY_DN30093_c0_g1_i1.p1 TRINITY_DN30093_c0_g1~~TRINITY_DN30093_c0_g1_i1.p1  ORF type:complete len:390 (-),score=50.89 TRINITY_DN30093_c0_g1_i1:55-1224(-)